MNKVIKQILAHRSIRKFKEMEISDSSLNTILEAATMASSSGNMQAYSIIVTKDKSMKKRMFNAHFNQSMLMDAPVFLTFCADFYRMREWLKIRNAPNNFDNFMSFMIGSIDSILASQNAALAAESLGLGICYMGTTLASADEIGSILELPKYVIPVVGFALGYPDETPVMRERLSLQGVVHNERYKKYSPNDIQNLYHEKECTGMKRYHEDKQLRKRIESLGVENLAQVYTKLKYTEDSHIGYSKMLLNYLKEQDFMK